MQGYAQLRPTQRLDAELPVVAIRPGVALRVRQRPARVDAVQRHGQRGRSSLLVQIRYLDGHWPETESLLLEVERDVDTAQSLLPCPEHRVNLTQFLRSGIELQRRNLILFPGFAPLAQSGLAGHEPDAAGPPPLPNPLSVALSPMCPDPHQTLPLEKALERRYVRLLLADEPGLGKTFQAALVAHELLLRRRAHRILVLCPPGLRSNWQAEMSRFADLDFDLIGEFNRGKCAPGNPWLSTDRAIASYYWLRQPQVLRQFLEAQEACGPSGPWDMLIVDEAHHLVPPAGSTSQLHQAISQVIGWFPHRVFVTATPHTGYTDSVMGLLQLLDPLRFSRTPTPPPDMRKAMKEVIIRRTRTQVAAQCPLPAEPRCTLIKASLPESEQRLHQAWEQLRHTLTLWTSDAPTVGPAWGLALQVLHKRLLSSLPAFAASFRMLMAACTHPQAAPSAGTVPALSAQELSLDDGPQTWRGWVDSLTALAQRHALPLEERLAGVEQALAMALHDTQGWGARLTTLSAWAARQVRQSPTERILLFTEFADTARSTADALTASGFAHDQVAELDASIGIARRSSLLHQFADPHSPLRLLVTTDVACEGLNLHQTCRAVIHLDLPWNPGRMAQRTGRVLRRGQQQPVTTMLVTSDTPAERLFLERIRVKGQAVVNDVGGTREGHLTAPDPCEVALPRQRLLPSPAFSQSGSGPSAEPAVCRELLPARGLAWAKAYRDRLGAPTSVPPMEPGSWCVARLSGWEAPADQAALLALARYLALDAADGWLLRWVMPLWFAVKGLPLHPRLGPPSTLQPEALSRLAQTALQSAGQDTASTEPGIPPALLLLLRLALQQTQKEGQQRMTQLLPAYYRSLLQQEHLQAQVLLEEAGNSVAASQLMRRSHRLSRIQALGRSRGCLFEADRTLQAEALRAAETRLVRSNQALQLAQQCALLDPLVNRAMARTLRARCSLAAPPVLVLEGAALLLPPRTEVVS